MLVGSAGGLNAWDGARWASAGAGNGLPAGAVTALAAQGEAVWVGTWGGGLGVWRDGTWQSWRAATSPLPTDWVSSLATDGPRVWVGTFGGGVAQLQGGQWITHTRASGHLPSDYVTCLLNDAEGNLWVGTASAGLARRTATGTWEALPLPTGLGEVTALTVLGRTLVVGTRQGLGLYQRDTQSWRLLARADGLPATAITALAAAPMGGVWVGTAEGLAYWDGARVQRNADDLPRRISALAVDGEGRLWVGSAGQGLAAQGAAFPPPVARRPVVLVHGWRGPESDLLEDSEFWFLARWLREDGFTPYYATGISPTQPLHENARRLRDTIARARRESGAAEVYVIAFSMGGLVTRAYTESTLYQGDVKRAFILGTPHRGEELWQTLLLWDGLAWSKEPSAWELLPTATDDFNRNHRNAWGVPYTFLVGDLRRDTTPRELPLPTLFRELPPSDGLVSAWSAWGPPGLAAERRLSADVHAWGKETLLLDIPSLLLPRTSYDAHIRPQLLSLDGARWATPEPAPPLPPDVPPRTGLRSGEIAAGQSLTTTLPLGGQGRATVVVRWQGAPLELSLRDPAGTLYTPDKLPPAERGEYLELDFADFASWVLTDTLPGPWSVVLRNDEERRVSRYVAYAGLPAAPRLTLRPAGAWFGPGEVITLTATLSDPLAAVDSVRVQVYPPGGPVQTISLTLAPPPERQGLGEGPGTRAYSAPYRLPAQSGLVALLGVAQGTRAGQPWESGAEAILGLRGDGARLSGEATLAQEGGRWVARVGVEVRARGEYLAVVALADAVGGEGTSVPHPARLAPGTATLTIPLPPALTATPRLGQVRLYDVRGAAVWLDTLPNP
jgi:hypothetical protein